MNTTQTKATHTPGPWLLVCTSSRFEVRTSPKACYAFSHADEANARLIAAAPELLEALKLAESMIEYLAPNGARATQATRDVIRNVIAKSEARA
jgi:hypothetical protein